MTQPYVGQILLYAFNFAPRDYAYCNGAQQAISQNQALFAILGTTYGGNGVTTFALPNIQDSTVMNIGQGPGLSNYVLGQQSGVASVTLTQNQIPQHNHIATAQAAAKADFSNTPAAQGWMGSRAGGGNLFSTAPSGGNFAASVISTTGGSLPHMNEQPFLGMNYCIALYGIFPTRN